MNELALFAGAGGGILGGVLLGWRTVCAVEFDQYARNVLIQRQNDGCLAPFPIWDDVRTFDGWPWRGCVDVVSGGFPCQDISCAGRGAGITGSRSGLWSEMFRIICEVGPRFVFVENSPMLTSRGLGHVLGDLASVGYDAEWMVLGADDVGAPHRRKRIWILAYAACSESRLQTQRQGRQSARRGGQDCGGLETQRGEVVAHANGLRELQPQGGERDQRGRVGNGGQDVADARSIGQPRSWRHFQPINTAEDCDWKTDRAFHVSQGGRGWWKSEPKLGRVANGVAHRVDRLRCIGNGQVPLVAATAFSILSQRIHNNP